MPGPDAPAHRDRTEAQRLRPGAGIEPRQTPVEDRRERGEGGGVILHRPAQHVGCDALRRTLGEPLHEQLLGHPGRQRCFCRPLDRPLHLAVPGAILAAEPLGDIPLRRGRHRGDDESRGEHPPASIPHGAQVSHLPRDGPGAIHQGTGARPAPGDPRSSLRRRRSNARRRTAAASPARAAIRSSWRSSARTRGRGSPKRSRCSARTAAAKTIGAASSGLRAPISCAAHLHGEPQHDLGHGSACRPRGDGPHAGCDRGSPGIVCRCGVADRRAGSRGDEHREQCDGHGSHDLSLLTGAGCC